MLFRPGKALARLVDPVITETFAGAMGFNVPLFPDFRAHLEESPALRVAFAGPYITVLVLLSGQRLSRFLQFIAARRWPRLELVDLALIVSLLAFSLLAFRLSASTSYRYLLPAVWVFPFLVGHLFAEAKGGWRKLIAGSAVALASFNTAESLELIREWNKLGAAQLFTGTHHIGALLDDLKRHGVRHCYATFWLAYRITFESNGEIVCTPPYNERVLGWPLPYQREVDTDPGTVYILTQAYGARFTILDMKKDLRESGIRAKTRQIGPFRIFFDFDEPLNGAGRLLDPGGYALRVDGEEGDLSVLSDFDRNTHWIASRSQYEGQGLEVVFDEPREVTAVSLFNIPGKRNGARAYRVLGRVEGEWIGLTHRSKVPEKLERWRFEFGHPIYGELRQQQVLLPPAVVDALRVEIAEPKTGAYWGLTGVEIHVLDEERAPGAAPAGMPAPLGS